MNHSGIARAGPAIGTLMISSDQYEEAIYQRIAPLEARGIRVLRLYGDGS